MLSRESLRADRSATSADKISDAETLDSIYYTVFPNFHPWGVVPAHRLPVPAQRGRPRDVAHGRLLLAPFKGERPPPAKTQ